MKRLFAACIAACSAVTLAPGAHAQAWPSKPIRIVIPFVAGGSSDIVGRFMQQEVDRWTGVVRRGGIKAE